MNTIDPEAIEKLRAALPMPRVLDQGIETEIRGGPLAVMQPAAKTIRDLELMGWPSWLAWAYGALYSEDVGVRDEQEAADLWAYRIARLLRQPVDYDRAQLSLLRSLVSDIHALDKSGLGTMLLWLYDNMLKGEDESRDLSAIANEADTGFRTILGMGWEAGLGPQDDAYLTINAGAQLDVQNVMWSLVDIHGNRAMEAEFPRFGMTEDLMNDLNDPIHQQFWQEAGPLVDAAERGVFRRLREYMATSMESQSAVSGQYDLLVEIDEWNDIYNREPGKN